jgi:hypothetical protein
MNITAPHHSGLLSSAGSAFDRSAQRCDSGVHGTAQKSEHCGNSYRD